MTAILTVSGFFILCLYVFILHKNAIMTFVSGAVYKWYLSNDKNNLIEPSVVQSLIVTSGFKLLRNITSLMIIGWVVVSIIWGQWVYLLVLPGGFVFAILVIKYTSRKFSVHKALTNASKSVRAKANRYNAHKLTANDIANGTLKSKLSSLDLLLEKENFIEFAQELRTTYLKR